MQVKQLLDASNAHKLDSPESNMLFNAGVLIRKQQAQLALLELFSAEQVKLHMQDTEAVHGDTYYLDYTDKQLQRELLNSIQENCL